MSKSILLDTSFIISLVDDRRTNHNKALSFYKYFIEEGYSMFLSTIVISEFSIKQDITDLPLNSFKILPFNYPESIGIKNIFMDHFKRVKDTERVAIKDDYKITCQAERCNIKYIITEDKPLFDALSNLKNTGIIRSNPIFLPTGHEKPFNLQSSIF